MHLSTSLIDHPDISVCGFPRSVTPAYKDFDSGAQRSEPCSQISRQVYERIQAEVALMSLRQIVLHRKAVELPRS